MNKMAKKVMAIGAHPDDVEFAMGGTITSMIENGYEVMILDLTNGEPTPHGSPEIRAKESKKAAHLLGVTRKTLEFENRFLFDNIDVRKAVAGEIREFRPDMLFVHYPDDAHPDHWAASILSMASRFYGKLSKVDIKGERFFAPRIFYFFSVHLRIAPVPDFCLDISQTFDKKLKAVLSYESQFHNLQNKYKTDKEDSSKEQVLSNFLKTQNAYWGSKIGVAYAEPFYSPEVLGFHNLDNLVL
ncbi:MAG: bacillithiol biosynthesis deacetylase BshB1 [Leptospirales bacterium]